MALGCIIETRKAGRDSMMLWSVICWETLGSSIHALLQGHPFMTTIFPKGRLLQQDSVTCLKANIVQEFQENEQRC